MEMNWIRHKAIMTKEKMEETMRMKLKGITSFLIIQNKYIRIKILALMTKKAMHLMMILMKMKNLKLQTQKGRCWVLKQHI